jgi:hypothetical protein
VLPIVLIEGVLDGHNREIIDEALVNLFSQETEAQVIILFTCLQ